MTETLNTAFRDQIKTALSLSKVDTVITEENVYQEGNADILSIMDDMVKTLILPGSGIDGMENIEDLFTKAKAGKPCLLLMEHYSNMDLSVLFTLLEMAGGRGNEIRNSIIAISGMKLNEDSPVVAAFASAYTRIVIYPSRSLQELDPDKYKVELARSNAINRAALKSLIRHKYKGNLVLVFPSGTRYRPWDPETKKGLREIDSYIRSFDYMCFVSLNGETLHVQETDMMNDAISEDIVRLTIGPVTDCSDFRNKVINNLDTTDTASEDKKQAVADAIMNELEKMHIAAEEKRRKLPK